MPRFFSLRDGDDVPDEEGLVLPDAGAARQEAIRNARDIMAEEVGHGRLPLKDRIEVGDEAGQTVLIVAFRDAVDTDE